MPPLSPSQLQAVTSRLDELAGAIHARAVVPLEQAYSPQAGLQPPQPGPGGRTVPAGYATATLAQVTIQPPAASRSREWTRLYVATPSLLAHYGITPSAIDPTADVLSARTDLGGLKIFTPEFRAGPPTPQSGPRAGGPGPEISDVTPKIQTFNSCPLYTSAPGTLLTTGALQRLGLEAVPAAWLIQASAPLTSQQIQTARAAAAGVGLYVGDQDQAGLIGPTAQLVDGRRHPARPRRARHDRRPDPQRDGR